MTNVSKKVLSKQVSQELDEIGFHRKRIRERIHASSISSKAKDISTKLILQTHEIEKIIVGSRCEGIGLPYFNDMDILQINHGISCTTDRRNIQTNGKLVFQMIQKKAPAGYTFLRLVNKETDRNMLENMKFAMVKTKRGKFLSSKIFMTQNDDVFKTGKGFISQNTCYKAPRGPSIPKYVKNESIEQYLSQMNLKQNEMDFVRALPCKAEWILKAWKERKRRYGWPSKKTIAHVMTLPTYVVPVGQKHSINDDLQWRISFTVPETYLIQAFNNTQMKVLVLMKLIAKYILQPICKHITSYVVKTVMLWMAENIPQKKFRQKHLITRLSNALEYLRTSVERKYLPSYMIPARNLFTNRLQKHQQTRVLNKLDFLITNGLKMITDILQNKSTHNYEISIVRKTIFKANVLDKFETCSMAMYKTQQLAEYCYTMFYISERWQANIYNLLFHVVPYMYTYGWRGFSDPLSIDLLDVFVKRKEEEHVALQHDVHDENSLPISQATSLATGRNHNILVIIPFNMLFPIFYLVFVAIYLLLKYCRIFLT